MRTPSCRFKEWICAASLAATSPFFALSMRGAPIEFKFQLPVQPGTEASFKREIFAEILTPAKMRICLPAFVTGSGSWAIRARPELVGTYDFGRVFEMVDGERRIVSPTLRTPAEVVVERTPARRPVQRDPNNSARFTFSDGSDYVPIGANLAWAPHDRVAWHLDALHQFGRQGLNWTRIWMCHWGGTNLDWLPADMGPSPTPGNLDARVAVSWDRILDAAEENGIYVQVVLQHHGQYATGANPNWNENPWNAANPGGFLKTPGEFFTSPRAIELTKQKYRYIVARWSHSPAVLAWELFNEVHWTNAYAMGHDEAAVAAWHTMMADYIRSIDPYHHLITTSTENLRSPIYAALDYYQPHLYAVDMLTAVRRYSQPLAMLDRPVFYGEVGDDKMPLSAEDKTSGAQVTPQVWASLMGPGQIPAQTWLGESLIDSSRVSELGAVARFLSATRLATRADLVPFSPAVEATARMPASITPGQEWERHVPGIIPVPMDGSSPVEFADIPGFLVGSPQSIAEGYPSEVTLRMELGHDAHAVANFADAGARGATVVFLIDGVETARHTWPRLAGAPATGPQPLDTPQRPAAVSFSLAAGLHEVTLKNIGGADWVRFGSLDLGDTTPVLAAVGKRSDDFIALWIWNKRGVHAAVAPKGSTATLLLDDVPAGDWQVTWWDSVRGIPEVPSMQAHAGGLLRLESPGVTRHAAVVLVRLSVAR